MKVKMLTRMSGPNGSFSIGQEIEVTGKEADDLISGGFAIPVQKQIETPEDNIVQETTAIRRKKRK